jgi:DNA repair exonuclease SbcCD ATPase subunit
MGRKDEERLVAIEERLELIEREVSNYLKTLNRVLNGLTTVNQRLVKEGSAPKERPSSETILNRIVELEDEIGECKAGVSRNADLIKSYCIQLNIISKQMTSAIESMPQTRQNKPTPTGACPACGGLAMEMVSSTGGEQLVCSQCKAVRVP